MKKPPIPNRGRVPSGGQARFQSGPKAVSDTDSAIGLQLSAVRRTLCGQIWGVNQQYVKYSVATQFFSFRLLRWLGFLRNKPC